MKSGMSRAQIAILGILILLGIGGVGFGGWLVWGTGNETSDAPAVPAAALDNPVRPPTLDARLDATRLIPTAAPTLTAYVDTPEAVLQTADPGSLPAALPAECIPASTAQMADHAVVLPDALIQAQVDGAKVDIRLIGVDPAGSGGQAQALLRELVEGKTIHLAGDGEDRDAQGRLRRYILAGDANIFVNYELVRRGAALPALFPSGFACAETFLSAERSAREEGLGYWSLQPALPTPVLPAATSASRACDCSVTYQCADFQTRSAAQACYNACGDYRNTTLDPDHNGLACEQLP